MSFNKNKGWCKESMKSNKIIKFFFRLITIVVIIVLTQGSCYAHTFDYHERISGKNRYETARKIASEVEAELRINKNIKSNCVVLAGGDDFPDSLSGSVLASKLNAPILLVSKNESDNIQAIKYYMESNINIDGEIYILGGYNSVPENFTNELKKIGYKNIKRVYGNDRYETNLKINEELDCQKKCDIVVSNSKVFADTLSISGYAGKLQMPIFLTDSKDIQKDTLEAIKKLEPSNIFITGGKNSISESIEKKLADIGNIKRIGGKDRYDTSIAISKYFMDDFQFLSIIASGNNFPDALTGSVLASKINAPIILVGDEVSRQKNFIDSTLGMNKLVFLGGKNTIPNFIENQMLASSYQQIGISGQQLKSNATKYGWIKDSEKDIFVFYGVNQGSFKIPHASLKIDGDRVGISISPHVLFIPDEPVWDLIDKTLKQIIPNTTVIDIRKELTPPDESKLISNGRLVRLNRGKIDIEPLN